MARWWHGRWGDLAHGRRLCKTGAGYDRVPDCYWARKRANRATRHRKSRRHRLWRRYCPSLGTARRRNARRPAYRTSRRAVKQVRHGFRDDDRFLVVAGLEVRRFVGHPVEGGMVLWPLGSFFRRLPPLAWTAGRGVGVVTKACPRGPGISTLSRWYRLNGAVRPAPGDRRVAAGPQGRP